VLLSQTEGTENRGELISEDVSESLLCWFEMCLA